MTREEAMARAQTMPRIEMLKGFKKNVTEYEWDEVHVVFKHGEKCGIINPNALEAVRNALLEEIDRQIEEEENK